MANYGIKVSEPGYDVLTAGITNQIFNSEKNCIKLATQGTVSRTLNPTDNSVVGIAHGFDFTPGFLCWFEVDDSGNWYHQYDDTGSFAYCYCYSTATNLILTFINNDSVQRTILANYTILADEGG